MPKLAPINSGSNNEAGEVSTPRGMYFTENRASPRTATKSSAPGQAVRPPQLPGFDAPSFRRCVSQEADLSARSTRRGGGTPRQTQPPSGLTPRANRPPQSPREMPGGFAVEVHRITRCRSADYRKVLGIAPGVADLPTIQSTYRQLMRVLHPDKRTDEEEARAGGRELCDEAVALVQRAMEAARQDTLLAAEPPSTETAARQVYAEGRPDFSVDLPVSARRGSREQPGQAAEDQRLRTPRSARNRQAEEERAGPQGALWRQHSPRDSARGEAREECPGAHGALWRQQSPRASARSHHGAREEREEQALDSGARYAGQWCGGQQDGEGTVTLPDGSRYRGQFAKGMAHGDGSFSTANGDMYQGQWHSDHAHGSGLYWGSDGRTYSGQWQNDTQHGRGTEVSADGTRYEGDFRQGLKHGVGKFSWRDGSVYDGQFNTNCINGFGIYVWANGRQYEGQWVKEKMHGHGKYTFPSGCTYVGEYKDDLKEGNGTFSWTDGHVYSGQWRGGKQDGFGTMSTPDGATRTGSWQGGRRVDTRAPRDYQESPRRSFSGKASPRGAAAWQRIHASPRGGASPRGLDRTPSKAASPRVEESTPRVKLGSARGAASRVTSILLGFAAAASPFPARAKSPAHKPIRGFVQPPRPRDPDASNLVL